MTSEAQPLVGAPKSSVRAPPSRLPAALATSCTRLPAENQESLHNFSWLRAN